MSGTDNARLLAALTLGLEKVLQGQLDRHRALLECLRRKREAIRVADLETINDLCRKEAALARRLEDLETKRGQLIERLGPLLRPGTGGPLTVREVAEMLEEPRRGVLLATAEQLRQIVPELRRESSVVRTAADALSRHVGGLMRSVRCTLSQAATYGRRGTLSETAPMQLGVDVRS